MQDPDPADFLSVEIKKLFEKSEKLGFQGEAVLQAVQKFSKLGGSKKQIPLLSEEVEKVIFKAMKTLKPAATQGALVYIPDLRRELREYFLDKESFDRAILNLAKLEKVQLQSHSLPAELTEEQRQQLTTTAALFPDELEDSELGEIPKEWKVTNFGEVSSCFDSKRVPLSKRQREQRQGNIPYYGATSIMDYVDDFLFDGVYLLTGEDGSVLKENGTPFVQYIWGKSWVNNHAHVLQGKNGVSTEHLMIFIQNQNITAYVTGAVQLKLNQKNMNSIPFIKATDPINHRFQIIIEPLYAKYQQATVEMASLVSLRDSLLPKLISGKIISDVSKISSEAAA